MLPLPVREHFSLMGRVVLAITGAGGLLGLLGVYQLVHGAPHHHRSAWFWLSLAFVILFLAEVRVAQRALGQRNAARSATHAITQTMVGIGEGASIEGMHLSSNRMTIGSELHTYAPQYLRRRRRLNGAERADLAVRCDTYSKELLEHLHRPSPSHWLLHQSDEERRIADEHRHAFDQETDRIFFVQHAGRARDLLNECLECGFSLEPELERFRTDGWANTLTMETVGQGLAVLASRVGRDARRLP